MVKGKKEYNAAQRFITMCRANPDKSEAAVAIEVLAWLIESSDISAVQGLGHLMSDAISDMCKTEESNISVQSACELFQRFITLVNLDIRDFEECKRVLLDRAAIFIKKNIFSLRPLDTLHDMYGIHAWVISLDMSGGRMKFGVDYRTTGFRVGACRQQIAENALPLIPHGARVLVHGRSRCVYSVLEAVAKLSAAACTKTGRSTKGGGDSSRTQHHSKLIHCYVTESQPEGAGRRMHKELRQLAGISSSLVPDVAVAYLMPQVDAVLLGAEAVVESGGILNRLGSCAMAMVAAECGKPVYVLAESFKFLRCFPLDQRHIPDRFKWPQGRSSTANPAAAITSTIGGEENSFPECDDAWERVERLRNVQLAADEMQLPSVDYTSPRYVTCLVTDLGVLTPSAISDELIKLYL